MPFYISVNILNRPLQWTVCLLHANELPFRHLFLKLDGTTTGPNSFSGSIGKLLNNCLKKEVIDFEPIPAELPNIDKESLSTDQKYLYEICIAISQGRVTTSLANRDPGKLAHSRWLTCANRVLRLYVGTQNPSQNLKDLATFILKVYAPTWFDIKMKSTIANGPIHMFNMIRRSSYLCQNLKDIVYKAIQRNAFFLHPENLLVAMLQDARQDIRELAVSHILNAREQSNDTVRQFVIPQLQYEAPVYYNIIDWTKEKIYEPPLTKPFNTFELQELISNEDRLKKVFGYPCHTQAVERCVKLVTEASLLVCGPEARDGFIKARILSRKSLPIFETKSQYFNTKEKNSDTDVSN